MTKEILREAQTWIAEQLEKTKQFPKIEIGYRFNSDYNTTLNSQNERNIYTTNENNKYLIIVNDQNLKIADDINNKIKVACKYNILPLHIQIKGNDFFQWANSPAKEARRNMPKDEVRRHIKTTKQERLIHEATGNVIYYNNNEKQLEVVNFLDTSKPNYDHVASEIIRKRELEAYKNIKDHKVIKVFPEFTLSEYKFRELKLAKPENLGTIESKINSLLALQRIALRNKQESPSADDIELRLDEILTLCSGITLKKLSDRFGSNLLGEYNLRIREEIPSGCCINY